MYFYYLSKFVELIETFLIVFRRSKLRFIHTYHHVLTGLFSYLGMYSKGTAAFFPILLNTMVHIPMYFYYLLVIVGYRDVWWKNYLTDFQLSQFVLDAAFGIFYVNYNLIVKKPIGASCSGEFKGAVSGVVIILTFYSMFYSMKQSYVAESITRKISLEKQKIEKQKKLKKSKVEN
jgi:hypothetical protein